MMTLVIVYLFQVMFSLLARNMMMTKGRALVQHIFLREPLTLISFKILYNIMDERGICFIKNRMMMIMQSKQEDLPY